MTVIDNAPAGHHDGTETMTTLTTAAATDAMPSLHFMHKGRRVESTSLKVLSERSGAGTGSSRRWTDRIIRTADGQAVAYISYNGRIWAGMKYVADGVCLYDPAEERREADRQAMAAGSIEGVWTVGA